MNKLEENYLNIPIIETERLILNYPLENDFKILEVFLKSERSKFIGGPYKSFTSWNDYMANIGHWSLYGYGLWSLRIKDNNEYPSYRGDAINGLSCTQQSRMPDPRRMIRAYEQSSFTLNLIRSMINSGYTNILNANQWDLDFIKKSPQMKK